jgi:hypothetical protein
MLARKKLIGFRFHAAPKLDKAGNERLSKDLKSFAKSLGFEGSILTIG